MILLTIVAFIVIFSLLVLVHEWGHFTVARRAGIKVEEFGIGLPPRAKTLFKDKQGTIYSLNWIPFGGYVRLHGEDSTDPQFLHDPKSFVSKSIGKRTAVIVAGVVMNFVMAWVLISIGFTVGMRPFLITQSDLERAIAAGVAHTETVLYVHEVEALSPAAAAGIEPGDLVIKLDAKSVPPSEAFKESLQKNRAHELTLLRKGEEKKVQVIPDDGGKIGVSISSEQFVREVEKVHYPFYLAPLYAGKEVIRLSVLTVQMLGRVVISLVSQFAVPEGVAGPVGIAQMTHTFVKQGFMALLQFTALISVSLGVINIMPFPALDGGRLLFIIFEVLLRRRPSVKWESTIHSVGFALLMLLIVAVTWNDIVNLIK